MGQRLLRSIIFLQATLMTCQFARGFSGTEGASFLDIPVGARPAALGGAYSALATDGYSVIYNPAGLGALDSTQVTGQHLAYLGSLHYEYLSLVHPLTPHDGLGVGVQYLGSGDVASTNDAGQSLGTYSDYFVAYSLSYGHAFDEHVSLGATGKWVHGKLSTVSADAFAGDLGSYFRINDQLSLAAVLTNLGSDFKFLTQKDSLPLAYKIGLGYQPTRALTWSVEGQYTKANLASFHTGLEWRPTQAVALRTGYRTDTTRELSALAGFTVGAGIFLWGQEFSYAWLPLGDLGNSNYFSVALRFGAGEVSRHVIQHTQGGHDAE